MIALNLNPKAMNRLNQWIRKHLLPRCPKCPEGRIRYSGEDWTGRVWLSIYECDRCQNEFI